MAVLGVQLGGGDAVHENGGLTSRPRVTEAR
jgi:hypothetical protein